MKYLVLTHFNIKAGPQVFLKAPESTSINEIQMIPNLLNLYNEGFFIHIFEGSKSYNYIFNIDSQYTRGNKEILLLSMMTEVNTALDAYFAEQILKDFARELNDITDAYQGFYFDKESKRFNIQKFNEVEHHFKSFYKSFKPTIEALKKAEIRYKKLFDAATDAIIIINQNTGEIMDANNQAVKLFNLKKEEIIGASIKEIISIDEEFEPQFDNLTDIILSEEDKKFVKWIKNPKGNHLYLEISTCFLQFEEADLIQCILKDRTAQKIAEKSILESEKKFQDLFEKTPASIVLTTPEGIMLECNPATERIFGFKKEEIIGKNYLSLGIYTPRQVRKFAKRFLAMKKGQEVEPFEMQIRKKDGSLAWIYYTSSLIRINETLLIEILIQDITEKKEAEIRLRESDERYRLITENANDMIAILNNNFEYEYINEEVTKKIMGYTFKDVIGKSSLKFIHPADLRRSVRHLRKGFQTGEGMGIVRFKKLNGDYIWLEVRGKTFIDKDGLKKAITISRDITERKITEQRLKESEEKYRNLFNSSPLSIMLLDSIGRIIECSPATKEIFGFNREELIGKSRFDLISIPSEIIPIVRNRVKNLLCGRNVNPFEYQCMKKDGSLIWVVVDSSLVKLDNKIYFHVISQDITQQKKSEIKLKESEVKYRHLFDKSPYSICLINQKGTIIDCNPITNNLLSKYTESDFIGKNVLDALKLTKLTKIIPLMKETYNRLLRGESTEPIELQITRLDGKILWLNIGYSLVRIGDEKLFQLIMQDITERRKFDKILQESEENYRTISEQSLMAIMIYQEGHITYANQAVSEINEYSVEEMKKMSKIQALRLIHPDDIKQIAEKMKIKPLGAREHKGETIFRVITKSNKIKWVQSFFRIFSIKGKLSVLLTMIDISRKIEIEHELKKSEEKYREAYNKVELYKNLFAHDIGNILQSIYSSIELFERHDKFHMEVYNFEDMVKNCKKKIQRGKSLISNVHKLSQVESTEKPLQKINAFHFLESTINLLRGSNYNKKININLDSTIGFPEENLYVYADEFLSDVFENIIINAIKHNNNQQVELLIKISSHNQNDKEYYKCEFIDNGNGISDERKPNIFKRNDNNYEYVKGLGIGLSLVKLVVSRYEGEIWVEDHIKGDYSKGSNFIILLPKAKIAHPIPV